MSDTPVPAPRILSVSELTRTIRALLETRIGSVWVEGEISNFRRQGSGHRYFTLKDNRSQLPCVLFRDEARQIAGPPLADGMQVQVFGEVTVYESRGQYQLIVQLVQPRGLGVLQARFEALKRKLQAEGLFDAGRKQPLPRFPWKIGLVTSPTGAALQDMLQVLGRRAPWVRVLIHPVRVQGQGAAAEIAQAITEFNAWAREAELPGLSSRRKVDLIVVARGGGSMEDLFEFNEETVARAIAASALPVVSAVGHEIDFTIADFAADVRAPTPSAAAELIVPDTVDLLRQLDGVRQGLSRQLSERVRHARDRIQAFARTALGREPLRRLLDARQQVDAAEEALRGAAAAILAGQRSRIEERRYLLRPHALRAALQVRREHLEGRQGRLARSGRQTLNGLQTRLRHAEGLLRVLGPQGTLDRGYSITTAEDGTLIAAVAQAVPGTAVRTRLADGAFISRIVESRSIERR